MGEVGRSGKIRARKRSPPPSSSRSRNMGDWASWYCGILLLGLILLGSIKESSMADDDHREDESDGTIRGNLVVDRACEEIYVVGEGETLHTISDKCGDPFIVERNPHIHDPDDVFPGLVIKITPSNSRKLLRK